MRSVVTAAALVVTLAACSKPADQAPPADSGQAAPSLTADLVGDISEVERKITALAKAFPDGKYNWRPAPGIRSVVEVLRHVASDNYFLPALLGTAPDSSTGIKGDDYKTTTAFEMRKVPRDTTIADLEKSFAFLKQTFQNTPAGALGEKVSFFGQESTRQAALVSATTHLHEHLGQLIAYARTNGVKPPWSE